LSVDVANSGSAYLNINAYGEVVLKKIDSSGNIVNLTSGDLRKNRYYLFIYNGLYYLMFGSGSMNADQILISGTSSNFIYINPSGVIADSGVPVVTSASGVYNSLTINTHGQVTNGTLNSYLSAIGTNDVTNGLVASGSSVSHRATAGSGSALKVFIDAYGHVTSRQTLLSSDLGTGSVGSGSKYLADNMTWKTITSSGSSGGSTIYTGEAPILVSDLVISHNDSVVVPGSYLKIEVDSKGHEISGSPLLSSDLGTGSVGSGSKYLADDLTWKTVISGSGSGGLVIEELGTTSIGGSNIPMIPYQWYLKKITVANNCMLENISVLVTKTAYTDQITNLNASIFSDSSGSPSLLLSATGYDNNYLFFSDPSQRWFNIPIGRFLSPNDYWIGVSTYAPDGVTQIPEIYFDSGSDSYFTSSGAWVSDGNYYAITSGSCNYSIKATTIR
jgi:hypothetical protein